MKNIFAKYKSDLKHISRVSIDSNNYLKVDDIQGSRMYFPRHDYNMSWGMLFYGCWEPVETEFIKKYVKQGMICIDVGAFIGYYTLLMARLVGKMGHVLSFEPIDESREACVQSAILNKYLNISFSDMVIMDFNGK